MTHRGSRRIGVLFSGLFTILAVLGVVAALAENSPGWAIYGAVCAALAVWSGLGLTRHGVPPRTRRRPHDQR